MDHSMKNQIAELLNRHVGKFSSQKKAVSSLRNVSESTVIQIRKGNWEGISEDMWRAVGKQVGFSNKGQWKFVPIGTTSSMTRLFDDAKKYGNVHAVTAAPGSGKTATARWYEEQNENTVHIECSEFMKKRDFLQSILTKLGKENAGVNVAEMMDSLIEILMKLEEPLIILDEVDKLTDSVLFFFITLYNQLHGKCGIVMLSTDYMSKRVLKGLKMNKRGYGEIFSRIGRRFIGLPEVKQAEVANICRYNGVEAEADITLIYNECEGDIRRVERSIHRIKILAGEKVRLKTA